MSYTSSKPLTMANEKSEERNNIDNISIMYHNKPPPQEKQEAAQSTKLVPSTPKALFLSWNGFVQDYCCQFETPAYVVFMSNCPNVRTDQWELSVCLFLFSQWFVLRRLSYTDCYMAIPRCLVMVLLAYLRHMTSLKNWATGLSLCKFSVMLLDTSQNTPVTPWSSS